MIRAQDLSKHFDEFVAVDGIDLEIPPGSVLVLLGPNGAGKTTTVRMLTSILVPTRGDAWINGFDVVAQPDRVRSSVGVLTEHHSLYSRMNAVEYLSFFGKLYGLHGQSLENRISQLLDDFNLTETNQKRIAEYSKGMRQKLALARALIHDPPVLLLDEPTSAMDPESARMVRNAIQKLRSGNRAILLCTHNLVEAEELADEIAIIRLGKIIARGSSKSLKERFLGPVEYEAIFTDSINGRNLPSLPGARLTGQGVNWLHYLVENPQQTNPALIKQLIGNQFDLVSFSEITHTLEQAYLEAVSLDSENGPYV